MLFAPRTVAAKKSGIVAWALTLGRQVSAPAQAVSGPRGIGILGLGRPPTLGAAASVPPALSRRFSCPLAVRRYCRLACLRRHRRAAARHSGLQYRAWGWVGRNDFSHPLSRHRLCRGRRAP